MAAMLSRNGEFCDLDQWKRNFVALNEQRNDSRFCDVVLRVCNTQIFAHSNILSAASPYFSSFLGTGTDYPRTFSQKQPQIIEIHVESVLINDGDGGYGEAVSKVVDYIYTSKINLTTTLVSQVIEIGKIMLLDKLLEFCYEFQKGINDNLPRDVFTCTSGLQEVASLLGARSKIVKRADAFTETDEALFAKLRCQSPPTIPPATFAVDVSNVAPILEISMGSGGTNNSHEDVIIKPIDSYIEPEKSIICDQVTKGKEPSSALPSVVETETPSLFDAFKQSESEPSTSTIPMFHKDANIDSTIEPIATAQPSCPTPKATSTTPKTQMNTTVESLENFGTMESFDDILNVPLTKDFPSTPEISNKAELNQTEPWPSQNIMASSAGTTDGTADVTFFSLPSTKSSQLIQRERSRGRRRGRRRGRPVGRPKKVKDPESDPEFDEFMKDLEKGDTNDTETTQTGPVQNVADEIIDHSSNVLNDKSSKKEDPDYVPINVKKDSLSSTDALSSISTWKSPRIRSKPSQLKKDYVLHSLSKKTRKPHSVAPHEQNALQTSTSKNISNTNKTAKTSNTLRFICQKCDFSTFVFRDYRQHLRFHPETDPRYFICPKCNFKTIKSREYNRHKKKHMAEEFICSYCDYQASSYLEYTDHWTKHSGEFPYFCTECDSRFRKRNQLMSHKPKHQLEKPFVCAICNAGFKWKHALKNHMITHSKTKDHLCDVCGYATAHKSQLKAHRLVHTGQTFKCSIPGCHFEATKRQKLKYHMVTHTHEKPHQCDVCGQRFSLYKNMRRHMLLHSNTRPYACKMCSFSTTRYDKLKEHNYKLHNIGEASVPKKAPPANMIGPTNVTYVKTDNLALNHIGALSEEALQTIAQLATSQQVSAPDMGVHQATINIEQPATDSSNPNPNFPIIARIQYAVDEGGLQYIAEITE